MIGGRRGWALPLLAVVGVVAVLVAARVLLTGDERPTSSAASPTPWCPSVGDVAPTSCVGYDGESAMALNHQYSQRASVPAARAEVLMADRRKVEEVIRQALRSTPVMTPQQVRAVLGAHGYRVSFGYRDGSGYTAATAFDFAVEKGGCILGELTPGHVMMGEVGGYIADGGCIPAFGH